MKLRILATSILLLLTACASGPPERMLVQKEVPQLPVLPPITGMSLSREDGEFLAGEAARAEQYLQERDFYYERYEAARKELKEIYGKD